MPKKATKCPDNIFYLRRAEASSWDENFSSRERTAEVLGIDRTRLAYIELEKINPHPDEALLLADAYRAPEICNYYCSKLCPIGQRTVAEVEINELERTVLQLLSAFRDLPKVKEELITIASDGVIHSDECPIMEGIIRKLDEAAARIQSLKLYYTKFYGNRTR